MQRNIPRQDLWLLILIWAVSLAFNINKAYHIDDTFHLLSAQWIAEHPLQPMSGFIVWANEPEKMAIFNQPPLYFYALAAVGSVFGYSEISMHLFQSLFVFGALWYFYQLALMLRPQHARLLLVLFGFCPMFMVNQNLMTDVVILMFATGAMYYLLRLHETGRLAHGIWAGVFIGISLLIKYSQLPFLVVMAGYLWYTGRQKQLWLLAIPVGMLMLWSVMNLLEFGVVHITHRPRNPMEFVARLNQTLGFWACMGITLPFAPLFIGQHWRTKKRLILFCSWFSFWVILAVGAYLGILNKAILDVLLNIVGIVVGLTLMLLCLIPAQPLLKKQPIDASTMLLLLWLLGIFGFMALFAPFVATRHMLLILPPMLLLLTPTQAFSEKPLTSWAVAFTIVMGLLLSYADWQYADFYRRMARTVQLPAQASVWEAGHWGWQWYIRERNVAQYASRATPLCVGDYLLYPVGISRQEIDASLVLAEVQRWTEPATLSTLVSVSDFAAMYTSGIAKSSWTFSQKPIDTIVLKRVVAIDSTKIQHP